MRKFTKKDKLPKRLIYLLVFGVLGIGNVLAQTKTIAFDRGLAMGSAKIFVLNGTMPDGSSCEISGDDFSTTDINIMGLGEHFYGYDTKGNNFEITFTNFKYQVNKITISASVRLGERTKGQGVLSMAPYEGAVVSNDIAPTQTLLQSQDFSSTSCNTGLKSIKYVQSNNSWTFFRASDFLIVEYSLPTISERTNLIGDDFTIGSTYTLSESSDIAWTNQGAFTNKDIVFVSNNQDVVSVSDNGKTITGVGIGSATITAKVVNGGVDVTGASFTFTVNIPKYISTVDNKTTATGTWTADELNDALQNGDAKSSTVIDLTGATFTSNTADEIAVKPSNPNALIYAKQGQVSNESNVIVDGVCNKLTLTDGYRFYADRDFVANITRYSRASTAEWGSICLPYAPEEKDGIVYYDLQSVGENSITFEKVDNPEANKPYLYKNTSGVAYNANYSGTINVISTPDAFDTQKDNYILRGAFYPTSVISGGDEYTTSYNENFNLETDPSAYYLKDNTFNLVNGRFNLNGFRAYLTSTAAGVKASTIIANFVDDEETTGVEFIENEKNGTVEVVFDIKGQRLNSPKKGVNIIKGHKVLVK